MKLTLSLLLAVFLHSQVTSGLDPTYDELKSQLPITLTPNGGDQYFFFIVPVQKSDEPNVILQMAQAQSATDYNNASMSATMINTHDNTVNVSTNVDNLNIDDVFKTPNMSGENDFNFQVPVIVPLDFRFQYDVSTNPDGLPQCSVDTRTWKEKVISKIAEKLDLPGDQQWDHSQLNIRIRLKKDTLAVMTLDHITNTDQLIDYIAIIQQTKILADIRYSYVLNGTTELTSAYVPIIAEGVDTYEVVIKAIAGAETVISVLSANPANSAALSVATTTIGMFKPEALINLDLFKKAFIVVKDLQEKEDMEDDMDI